MVGYCGRQALARFTEGENHKVLSKCYGTEGQKKNAGERTGDRCVEKVACGILLFAEDRQLERLRLEERDGRTERRNVEDDD